jgi:uncharacterized membrane protein (DUF485 family)
MSTAVYQQIRSNRRYPEMVARRRRLSVWMATIVLGTFFGFILVVAFDPKLLATPLAEGMATTIAIPIGVAMIVVYWLLTGLYVRRASHFDKINVDILHEVLK